MKSTHECEHQIDKQLHHLTSATCREQHVFRPFSRGDNGAVTSSTQKLQLIKQTQGTRPTCELTSILFRILENGADHLGHFHIFIVKFLVASFCLYTPLKKIWSPKILRVVNCFCTLYTFDEMVDLFYS